MRLLKLGHSGKISITTFIGTHTPQYAILSHTWGDSDDEVTFRDIVDGTGEQKSGFTKLRFCARQAAKDGLQYFWVDTCCINKDSETELSEAIRCMFRWYEQASRCYVYLSDVSLTNWQWHRDFHGSRWFTRGWTLQELLAPRNVEFYSCESKILGDKETLEQQIHERTKIPKDALRGKSLSTFSVTERFSWIENRTTTREEDLAYSLLGVFDIHMSLLYGEGKNRALERLGQEIQIRQREKSPYFPLVNKRVFLYITVSLLFAMACLIWWNPAFTHPKVRQGFKASKLNSHRFVDAQENETVVQIDRSLPIIAIMGDEGVGKMPFIASLEGRAVSRRGSMNLDGRQTGASNLPLYKFRTQDNNHAYILNSGTDSVSNLTTMVNLIWQLTDLSAEHTHFKGIVVLWDINRPPEDGLVQCLTSLEYFFRPDNPKSIAVVTANYPLTMGYQDLGLSAPLEEKLLFYHDNVYRYDGSSFTAFKIISALLEQPDVDRNSFFYGWYQYQYEYEYSSSPYIRTVAIIGDWILDRAGPFLLPITSILAVLGLNSLASVYSIPYFRSPAWSIYVLSVWIIYWVLSYLGY